MTHLLIEEEFVGNAMSEHWLPVEWTCSRNFNGHAINLVLSTLNLKGCLIWIPCWNCMGPKISFAGIVSYFEI